jgi:hypothetical protein
MVSQSSDSPSIRRKRRVLERSRAITASSSFFFSISLAIEAVFDACVLAAWDALADATDCLFMIKSKDASSTCFARRAAPFLRRLFVHIVSWTVYIIIDFCFHLWPSWTAAGMNGSLEPTTSHSLTNGHDVLDGPPLELLEAELPVVDDDQVPLGEVASRVVQACYAELSEIAETYVCMYHLCTLVS